MNIQVSQDFKDKARKAVSAIFVFIFTYVFIVSVALFLTVACVLVSFLLISEKPSGLTIGLGVGVSSLGFFIIVFLFKFLFKKYKVDRSHLIEISQEDQPRLFALIREVANEVDTSFPKKIFLSSDVNAAVFYDSTFWSMLLPVRKNLQIGMGLVNIVSEQEFKAILAHEFGHFSQRSMKVGSYVYNVNQVIYNMLYENESFDKMIVTWSKFSGYFAMFLNVAVTIIENIQGVLKKMYNYVNVRYMALSREMEFHADEIAAHVAGSSYLKESLLRLDLAEYSYNTVLTFYNDKINDNIKSSNVFLEQSFVMHYLAKQSKLSFKDNLPLVTESDTNRYNKSKLTVKDQWASHPTIAERIKALDALGIQKSGSHRSAMDLFDNPVHYQKKVTQKVFSTVEYAGETTELDLEVFQKEYSETILKNSFSPAYNSYYDNKNPFNFDINSVEDFEISENLTTLFSNEKVDWVYEYIALENDKYAVSQIANKEVEVKSFDYDGKKYTVKEASELIPYLEERGKQLREKIQENDIRIYKYFYSASVKKGNASAFREKYLDFFRYESVFDAHMTLINTFNASVAFINVVTPFEQIKMNLLELGLVEKDIKSELRKLMKDPMMEGEVTLEMKEVLEEYLSQDWVYFTGQSYRDEKLQLLFSAVNNFNYLVNRKYFLVKLDLLNYQMAQLD